MKGLSSSRRVVDPHQQPPQAAGRECHRLGVHSPSVAHRRRLKTRPLHSVATSASVSGGPRCRSMQIDRVYPCVFDQAGHHRLLFRVASSVSAPLTSLGDGATACFGVGRLDRRVRGDGAMNGACGGGRVPCPGTKLASIFIQCFNIDTYFGAVMSVATPTPVALLVFLLFALRKLFFKVLETHGCGRSGID
jgi:hypothetical protein